MCRGIINQGVFFAPYYLFHLLARRHADELDRQQDAGQKNDWCC
jgi:hypothetical protein